MIDFALDDERSGLDNNSKNVLVLAYIGHIHILWIKSPFIYVMKGNAYLS